jgi:hypothetical protein
MNEIKYIECKKELKEYEEKLESLRKYNESIWSTYGSELSANELIRDEERIEKKIKELKLKLEL